MDSIRELTDLHELDRLIEASKEQPVLLYKHSQTCGLSTWARQEIEQLATTTDLPVYQVTVQTHREISDAIATQTGIRHESPQVILLVDGRPVFHTSHSKVRADYLRKKLAPYLRESKREPEKSLLKRLLPLVLLATLFLATGCRSQQQQVPPPLKAHTEITQAPDFTLPTLEGETFRLSDHRGKVVILNFWATWCAPCRAEIPDFIELQQEFGADRLLIVGISLDEEGESAVRPFVEQMGINYPIVIDDGTVSQLFGGVYAIPTTIIVDQEGKIYKRFEGMTNAPSLRRLLQPLLGEAVAEVAEPVHVTPEEAWKLIQQGAYFVDVRNPEELPRQGAAKGAVLIPLPGLSKEKLPDDPERPIVFICRSGRRSAIAAQQAAEWGYRHVYTIDGGILAWKKANLPTE